MKHGLEQNLGRPLVAPWLAPCSRRVPAMSERCACPRDAMLWTSFGLALDRNSRWVGELHRSADTVRVASRLHDLRYGILFPRLGCVHRVSVVRRKTC